MNKNITIIIIILMILFGVSYYFFTKYRESSLVPELPQPPIPPVSTTTKLLTSTLTEIPSATSVNLTSTVSTSTTTTKTITTTKATKTVSTISEVIIKITNNGFVPKEVEVTKGTKVTWVNESSNPSWPASAVHPTHRVYPGSGIEKCGTSEEKNIFDACRNLKPGEKWSFTFNKVGEWYYHDHSNPSFTGEITVK
jgi:plastocyanin